MSHNDVYLQPSYILHTRKYRETSLILEVLTEDFGKLSVLAKGVRKSKSGLAGVLRSFIPLKLSFTGKSDLKTLVHAEAVPPLVELNRLALYCGLYINELTDCFLQKFDPHPEIFESYRRCIKSLASEPALEPALRLFELELLEGVGYGLQLTCDAISGLPLEYDDHYSYHREKGPYADAGGPFRGATLIALSSKRLSDKQTQMEAKKLMRQQIDFFLQGRELKSRLLITRLFKQKQ